MRRAEVLIIWFFTYPQLPIHTKSLQLQCHLSNLCQQSSRPSDSIGKNHRGITWIKMSCVFSDSLKTCGTCEWPNIISYWKKTRIVCLWNKSMLLNKQLRGSLRFLGQMNGMDLDQSDITLYNIYYKLITKYCRSLYICTKQKTLISVHSNVCR